MNLQTLIDLALASRYDNLHDMGYRFPYTPDETDPEIENVRSHLDDVIKLKTETKTLQQVIDIMSEDWVRFAILDNLIGELGETNDLIQEFAEHLDDEEIESATTDIRNAIETLDKKLYEMDEEKVNKPATLKIYVAVKESGGLVESVDVYRSKDDADQDVKEYKEQNPESDTDGSQVWEVAL